MEREREGARFSPVPNKSKRFCCVYGCKSLTKRDTTVRFHRFPKEGEFVKIPLFIFKNQTSVDFVWCFF